ncbi:MAG: AmmeMemoRadiSam system protein B [Deltaproteobacteria bacterium]|nr:AmmeMemoRadiSam system protein B [Deltaproteobacteria bacterium]
MPIRRANFGKPWYPSEARCCESELANFERGAIRPDTSHPFRAAIVPHAAWVFSGQLAYEAIAALRETRVETVVLFAGHLPPGNPATLMVDASFETPLGEIAGDTELAQEIAAALPTARVEDVDNHSQDHATEVTLPMLRALLPSARLVHIGAPPEEEWVERISEAVANACQRRRREAVFIGSTDLTHYGPNYDFMPHGLGAEAERWARQHNDRAFIDAALNGDHRTMVHHALAKFSACCPGAAAAALRCASLTAAPRPTLLRHRQSCELLPSESFVGYASIVA